MKSAQREVYIELGREINGTLCSWCKHSSWVGSCCSECWNECDHPLEAVVDREQEPAPGDDCWGFRSMFRVADIADIVGIVLTKNWDEWGFIRGEGGEIRVYGSGPIN